MVIRIAATRHVETCVLLCREKPEKVLSFKHFCDIQTFTENGVDGKKKGQNRSIGVSIAKQPLYSNLLDEVEGEETTR